MTLKDTLQNQVTEYAQKNKRNKIIAVISLLVLGGLATIFIGSDTGKTILEAAISTNDLAVVSNTEVVGVGSTVTATVIDSGTVEIK